MKALRVLAGFALIVLALFVCAGRVQATDLSGSYSTTQYINDDSRLVGDVTCEPTLAKEPCIVFGAPHIKLRLNGFTITGPVDPITNRAACGTIPDFQSGAIGIGVEAVAQNDIEIEGPGQIRHFVNWGIFLGNKTFATPGMPPEVTGLIVRGVTAAFNCWSGVQILGVADSTFEDNVLANNAVGSNGAGCGGICLSDSSKNRFHKNAFNGNGAATPGSSSGANNFGIGLEGMSNENQIEENEIGGNVNGVLVFATASGNVVRHNIIVGNPPAQVSVSFTATTSAGADIHDRHTSGGTNTFEDNFCLTYLGPSPAACPNGIKEGSEEAAGRATVPLKGSNGPTTAIASFLSIATERANWQREIALALLPLAFLVAALVSSSRSRKHFSKS